MAYKVLFMGYLVELLDAIYRSPSVEKVITVIEPQRKNASEIIDYCEKHSIDYLLEKRIRTSKQFVEFAGDNVDLIVVGAFGQILDKKILALPRFGVINFHPSLLPRYRGGSPIEEQILNGEKKGGYTLSWMTEKVDSGPLLSQDSFVIEERDCYRSVLSKSLAKAASAINELFGKPIESWPRKEIESCEKIHSPRTMEDGVISWNESGIDILRKVRAFGWRGWAVSAIGDKGKVFIKTAEITECSKKYKVGTVFKDGDKVIVLCSDGAVELLEYQVEGILENGDVLTEFFNSK